LFVDFSQIIGLRHLKNHLTTTVAEGRIPHAQLFSGSSGSGLLPLALAYANSILCSSLNPADKAFERCARQVGALSHPDLHFVFPVNTTAEVKKTPRSNDFISAWRSFVSQTPYGSLFSWYQHLGIDKKQGSISVAEAEQMAKTLYLKSYEGGFKVVIIWMAEKMTAECANKMLKLLEEPPAQTVFLLLTEHEDQILRTIYSRCQKLNIPLLSEHDLSQGLMAHHNCTTSEALRISKIAHGDYFKARQLLANKEEDVPFEAWFLAWARGAFKAKGNKKVIQDLLAWSDQMSSLGRETQKSFLLYCSELLRQAFLTHYGVKELVYYQEHDEGFSLDRLAPFIHQNNIHAIQSALETAHYHIERNGNPKLIFTDLAVQMTRLLHQKP
jgi:DNA polymerase III subunit delta'